MNNKTKIAILLLSLTSLTACDSSDDKSTISSDTTVGQETPVGVDIAVNGSFEDWTDATTPTDWTNIYAGLTVAQDNTIFRTDSSSAAVTVVKNKKNILQSVDVVNGKTYTLSMSVYHPANGLSARLYLADYTDAESDPTLNGQWQDISAEYTATENKVINIGMRFYTKDSFNTSEIAYIDNLTLMETGTAKAPVPLLPPPLISKDPVALAAYYDSAKDKTGFELKTALYDIIKGHTTKTYTDLWTFMSTYSLDTYYENDNTILDMYTENPSASDSYNFAPVLKQCGNYSVEGDCYNREHSMPQSWFIKASPMVSDVHHIFATDGKVNGKRSNFPYGEVETATYTSSNGSKLGSPTAALGFAGDTVFEPIDEFKGDLARAYFYMATRYEDRIGSWQANSDNANAVLNGSTDVVFESWVIVMLKRWNENDPVSPKEQYRNDAAFQYQGNRNPFVDHPEYVNEIWVD